MRTRIATLAALALGLLGCAPKLGGQASFPVLSKSTLPNYYEPIATVDEKRCSHFLLFGLVIWGDDANHEAVVTDILAEHKGDAIIDADLTFFSVPALVYNQQCARVTGTVVRRTAAGRAAGERPPPVQPATPAPGGAP